MTFSANSKSIAASASRPRNWFEGWPSQNLRVAAFRQDPAKRTLLRVVLLADDREGTADSVERLMGTKAEARFAFISDKAEFASEDLLDV